jgi:tetratricopeptide (TPR) repeat protein
MKTDEPAVLECETSRSSAPVTEVEERPGFPRRWRVRRLAWLLLGVLVLAAAAAVLGSRVWVRADPDRIWSQAEQAFLSGRWDEARASLQRLEKIRPPTGLDLMLEGQLAIAEGRFDEGHSALSRIADDHPIAAQAHLLRGRLWRQHRCLRNAESEFRHALRIEPGQIDAHKELIYILGIQSRRAEVDAEFRALARLAPLSHHDLFTWALTHFTHWNPDIVADLDGFIAADPGDRLSRLAVVELLLERPGDEVDAYIEKTLRPLPEFDPEALALRINFAFNRGHYERAEQLLDSAPSGHPRLARIRGELALRRHQIDAAIAHFKEALSAEPYDRVSPMHLAQALKLKGDLAAAQAHLERIEKLNKIYNLVIRVRSPKHENKVTDLAELGEACEAAGLADEARGWFTLAIAIDPLDADAQRALGRLGSTHRDR